MEEEIHRRSVREGYGKIANEGLRCNASTSCCESPTPHEELSKKMGYTQEELNSIPEGSNLGLGCGNPVALASLKEGETIIDLGSGTGVDCFLAAKKVGEKGKVIGIDMTSEMLDKARENARKGNYKNVEFRRGEIEHLPVANNTADVIISNCVINLASNKKKVYEEAFRVLKPGGRIMVSDLVLKKELSTAIRERASPCSCIKTAILKDKYLETMEEAGFNEIRILNEQEYCSQELMEDPNAKVIVANRNTGAQELKSISELDEESKEMVKEALASTLSISVSAIKPKGANRSTKFYITNPERPLITVKGTINQRGPFSFIFDTGASMTVIEKETAIKLGLYEKAVGTREAHGAGGALSSSMVIVESIKVGDVEARDIQVGVLDLSNLMKCACMEEFAGIIGYNFVKDYRVTIDYPKQEICFE